MKATKTQPDEPTLRESLRALQGERAIPFERLLEALEAALISAYKRNFGAEANAIVSIDRQTGDYKVYHRRNVVEDVADPKLEISRRRGRREVRAGRLLRRGSHAERIRPHRRANRQASHRPAHPRGRARHRSTTRIQPKLHDIVDGHGAALRAAQHVRRCSTTRTKRCCRSPSKCRARTIRINDRIRAYVLDVRKTNKGPLVVLSRAAEGLVQRLIEFQVPEIQDDIVEIMAIAREPGSRTKVAVHSKRPEIDAVGACLGPKSSRIANVSDELRGEKIDVIRYVARSCRRSSRTRWRRPRCSASSCSRTKASRW